MTLAVKDGGGVSRNLATITESSELVPRHAPAAEQDPIYDHANGTKTSVTASATVITPPAGCKFVEIDTDATIYVNTANATAIDNGTAIRVLADQPRIVPVTAATAVKALSASGTAVVRCTPLKVR